MRKILCLLTLLFSHSVFAMLNMELTQGTAGAVPIVIEHFADASTAPQNVSEIITNDLTNSGRFKVFAETDNNALRQLGVDNQVTGTVKPLGNNQYRVSFTLSSVFKGKHANDHPLLDKHFTVKGERLRPLAHYISDLIYEKILGVRGVFSTRLAYVVVERPANKPPVYRLEVSDQDGYQPRALLISKDPIMSPAWSPNGKQIAYVSFENKRAGIYIQNIEKGTRQKVTSYPGINGAPAWSPDGKKLALVLSKDGSPNIYVLDLASRKLTEVTHDWSINVEPAWSPDGKSIVFTSNRGGGPQIYQKDLVANKVSRITYDGSYNARPSFTKDGNHLVLLNQEAKYFNIGILDLDNGMFKVLTNGSGTDNQSPSVAPNGSMVLYETLYQGRSILAMTATDGSVQLRLPARSGEVQDPAWSPFLD